MVDTADIDPNVFLSWHFFVCDRVVDGDTIEGMLDQRFYDYKRTLIRLYGIDTPELNDSDPDKRAIAKTAKTFVEARILNQKLKVNTLKPDKYNLRIVGTVYYPKRGDFGLEWINLNQELLGNGLAKEYKP